MEIRYFGFDENSAHKTSREIGFSGLSTSVPQIPSSFIITKYRDIEYLLTFESFDAYGQITHYMTENKEIQDNRECFLLNQIRISSVARAFQNGFAVRFDSRSQRHFP